MLHTISSVNKSILLILFFSCTTTTIFSNQSDTIPPQFSWISPKEHSIHTTNSVRLCVDAHDNEGGSGLKVVVFYTNYLDNNGRKARNKIGEVFNFPYEITWNCTDIQDQSHENLQLECEVIDNAGNVNNFPTDSNSGLHHFVLDRNPHLSNARLLSHRIEDDINLDGKLNDWAPRDSVVFSNNDNTVIVYSSWNNTNVYFGIRVEDRSIVNQHEFDTSSEPQEIYHQDDVEIYLDVDHDHNQIRDFPDRTYLIAPSGAMYERMVSFDGSNYNEWKEFDINTEIYIRGTLNNDQDVDTYYSIELAIPWEKLGIKAQETNSLGLNIWNCDKDYVDGDYYYSSWTTQMGNQENPSEWGNVVFISRSKLLKHALLLCIGITLGVIIIAQHKLHTKKNHKKHHNVEKECIVKAKKYIEENYSKEHLTREEVAKSVNLTSSYFGNLFKKETGLNFTEYLISVKIDKAKYLLIHTDKTISEIAFEVGFSSSSYFGSLFKKNEKASPKEFRKKIH